MRQVAGFLKWWFALALLAPAFDLRAAAQIGQLLPRIDPCYKVTSDLRINIQAKETREAGATGC
jgi:hypothetical protein